MPRDGPSERSNPSAMIRHSAGHAPFGDRRATSGVTTKLDNREREPLDAKAGKVLEPVLAVDEVLRPS